MLNLIYAAKFFNLMHWTMFMIGQGYTSLRKCINNKYLFVLVLFSIKFYYY